MRFAAKLILFLGLLCLSPTSLAGSALSEQINEIVNRPSQKKVRFSIRILEADSGRLLYDYNAAAAMVPASNMKLIVTAAAIKYLGPNYKYKTRLGLCGENLVIIGSGDPLLGDKQTDEKYERKAGWIFDAVVEALKKRGVTHIRDIIIDTGIFDNQRIHPNWPPSELNRHYACELSGLNFNGNCIRITTKNNAGTVNISIEPPTGYVQLINKVVPVEKGRSAVGAYRTKQPNKLLVKGRCRKQQGPFSVAIERPAGFFGFLLAENLAKSQINVQGQLIEKLLDDDCPFAELLVHTTPLADCLSRCNKDSFGLAAEALLKTISAAANPNQKLGSWPDGQRLVTEYLLSLGIDRSQFHIDDGSGLSRANRLSANAVTTVLLDLYKSKNWDMYRDSLAIGGTDGTIAKYFKEDRYRKKVFAKTGYISAVKSLSGLCSTDSGDRIFAILANNANAKTRKAINDIVKAVIDTESPPAPAKQSK